MAKSLAHRWCCSWSFRLWSSVAWWARTWMA